MPPLFLYQKPTILVITNSESDTTRYGYYYSQNFINEATREDYQVIHLNNPILSDLKNTLYTYDPKLVVAFGVHGGFRGVLTQDNHITIGVKGYDEELSLTLYRSNVNWFNNKIIFLLSCFSGRILGRKLVEEGGAEAVVAWAKPYFFIGEDNPLSYEDEKALPFFKPPLKFLNMLIHGYTVGEAYQEMKQLYIEEAYKWRNTDKDVYKYLKYDLSHTTLYGNPNAKLI